MTASPDVAPLVPLTAQGRSLRAHRMLTCTLKFAGGGALMVAALALWLMPGSSVAADLIVPKLALTCFLVIAALPLLRPLTATPSVAPSVQIDSIRREVRILRPATADQPHTVETCTFGALSKVERAGASLRFFGPDGGLLTEVTLGRRDVLNSVVGGLQDAKKL